MEIRMYKGWRNFVVSIFLLVSGSLHAQLTVVQGAAMNLTPLQLVQQYLVGAGITISNATYNGSSDTIRSNQIGTFSTSGTANLQLGLSGGVLMTSGRANVAIGPNNSTGAGFNASGSGDPDLNIISNSSTHDKCVLEFDFVPQYDTVRFRYVFGSEEFYEFCHQFNDAFGFFLSGPGISGTFSNNSINIALMPGSLSEPVTINNICADDLTNWHNAGGLYYQYDGITHVFTAWHVVTPCQTYHIKLAVADAVDFEYDSGVFLEENSFSSPGVTIVTGNTVPALGNVAYEGCNDIAVNFRLSSVLSYAVTINYIVSGTAVNGADYSQIPDFVVFPAGSDSVNVIIHPVFDNIPEGRRSVILTLDQITCTGLPVADTVWIDDYSLMSLKPLRDTTVCEGYPVSYAAIRTGGMPPYLYQWSISPLNDSIITVVPPVGNNTVILNVNDVCNNVVTQTAFLNVNPTPLSYAGSTVTIPNGTSTTLNGAASGGSGNYGFSWTSIPPGFTSALQSPSTGNLYFTTIFSLVVTDLSTGCQSIPSDVTVIVEGGPLSANPGSDPPVVCYGDPSQLFALAGGGSGLYTYSWTSSPAGFTSTLQNPFVTPPGNTDYYLSVNDGYNIAYGSTHISVNPLPVIRLGPADTIVCIYDTVKLDAGNPGSVYFWSNGSTSRSITVSSSGIGYEVQHYWVGVTNPNQCMDTSSINVVFTFGACTGVDEHSNESRFSFYPNPAEGSVNFIMNPAISQVTIGFYTVYGNKVLSEQLSGTSGGSIAKTIDVSMLARGIYIAKVSGDHYYGSAKLVIR
ncbi:MAG: choice-of-anchor L domain-containing protein [Bacteroidetes bacterium]|nr:choice-of-anchor L domain-containing protein [Bacteroidota bacterium]